MQQQSHQWQQPHMPQQQQMQQQHQMQQQQPQMQQHQMQQQYVGQNPGVTVITRNPPDVDRNKLKPSALSQMKGLSITQIAMGSLCVLFGIILVCLEYAYDAPTYHFSDVGYGIWNGVYFIIVGGVGLGAVRNNTNSWIISAMILNIICSTIFFLPMLILCAVGLGIADNHLWCYQLIDDCGDTSVNQSIIAFNSLMMLMCIAELIVTIWSAALCCGAVCNCCYPSQGGQVYQCVTTTTTVPMQPAPTTAVYGVNAPMYPNSSAYSPAPVHQQPPGGYMVQPQGLPSYDTVVQNTPTQNSGYEQALPPTAKPTAPEYHGNQ